jgi:hypothetical protein
LLGASIKITRRPIVIALLVEFGPFIFSDREDRRDSQVLRYKVSLGGNSYWFSANMTRDGKIAQVYWW